MPNLQNLLKRRPVVVELDPEVHARLRARLAALHEPDEFDPEHEFEDPPDQGSSSTAAIVEPASEMPRPILMRAPTDLDADADADADEPAAGPDTDGWDATPSLDDPAWGSLDEPAPASIEVLPEPDIEIPVTTGTEIANPVDRPKRTRAPRPIARIAPTPPARAPAARRIRSTRVLVACPYCAEPLKTPPVASGKCPRCRLRIVVKRVGDRNIYLTEAALPVFLAQRRRALHAGRWTLERDRWLELAKASGAEPQSLARLTRLPVSEEVIASARNLYMSTVERGARAARRERRWEDAGRLRYDQAHALYRNARSPKPVPADVLAVHRDGLNSSLRGIAEVAKGAEMRARACCEACLADDGRMVRISDELRVPTLPHETCERGLCRCRWYLAARDRAIVTDLLKRATRVQR